MLRPVYFSLDGLLFDKAEAAVCANRRFPEIKRAVCSVLPPVGIAFLFQLLPILFQFSGLPVCLAGTTLPDLSLVLFPLRALCALAGGRRPPARGRGSNK